jgi:uncharacterized protein
MAAALQNLAVRCPTCRKRGLWFAAVWGPFCSERCQLIDLGKWLGEEHVISEPLQPAHIEAESHVSPYPPPPAQGRPSELTRP